MNKKILLITYNFPPIMSPNSLRWFYLSRELSKQGYLIDILTIKMPEKFRDMLDELPDGIKISRTFPGPFYYLTYRYSREDSLSSKSNGFNKQFSFWKMVSSIHLRVYRTLNALLFPDIYAEWIFSALIKGYSLIKKNIYDVIISSSDPRTSHLIGYLLSRKSGIPLLSDYGDPWIWPMPIFYEPHLKKKFIENTEKKILSHMKAITVTTEGTKQYYLERYPFLNEINIHVIPQGYDHHMFSKVENINSSTFRIVYCGSFYRDLRDPMPFFEAVRDINDDNIEVIIAGRIGEFAEIVKSEKYSEKIRYLGFVSHKESLALEKSAAVLLHISNTSEMQVPGKLYEYIGAGRPILCIKGSKDDLSAELVIRHNKGIVTINKKEEIKAAITKLYDLWQRDLLDKQFDLNEVFEFSWEKRAEDLNNIIKNI